MALLLVLGLARPAQAEPMKEFVTSATYGVLAGTLVGAATLAFTKKPGDNLGNIARGASYGLYAGILLGAYVVYGVPAQGEGEGEGEEQQPPPEEQPAEGSDKSSRHIHIESIYPMISQRGIDGIGVNLNLLSF